MSTRKTRDDASGPFFGTEDPALLAEMKAAHATNLSRMRDEVRHGWASPESGPLALLLRTAISAFVAGLHTGDRACLVEGVAMVQVAELRARQVVGPFSARVVPKTGAEIPADGFAEVYPVAEGDGR
jgi:hypothetical protein